MNALIWKEFRENARWLPVGLVIVTLIVWMVIPDRGDIQSLIARDLVGRLAIVLPLFAFALGVVQSYRDLQPAAGGYLHHRSVTPRQVFRAKTLAGFCIYALAVTLPLLGLASWIGIRGMQWHAMRPAQVIPGFVFALAAFAMHPAALIMMVRDVSWWRTRLFPLLPAGAALFAFVQALRTGGLSGAAYAMVAAAIAIAWLIMIALQSWRELASDPPASKTNTRLRRRWLLPSYLTISALLAVMALMAFLTVISESLTRSYLDSLPYSNHLAISAESGDAWLLTYAQERTETGELESVAIGGDRIESGRTVNPLKPLDSDRRFIKLARLTPVESRTHTMHDGFFSMPHALGQSRYWYSFDHRGYLLGYSGFPRRWSRTIAADGIHPPGQLAGQPFSGDPVGLAWYVFSSLTDAGYEAPLIDSRGVYLIEKKPSTIRKLIDQRIDAAAMLESEEGRAPRLLLRSQRELTEYKLVDASGSDTWFAKPGDVLKPRVLDDLQLSAQIVRSVNLPPALLPLSLSVATARDGFVVAAIERPDQIFVNSPDGTFQPITYDIAPGASSPPVDDRVQPPFLITAWFPGSVLLVAAVGSTWQSAARGNPAGWLEWMRAHPIQTGTFAAMLISSMLVALVLVAFAARARDLRRGQLIAWALSVPLLGLAAPLAVLTVYRAVHREPCPQCEKPRRIDQNQCRHCGAEWEQPQSEGIEIIDRQESQQRDRSASLV